MENDNKLEGIYIDTVGENFVCNETRGNEDFHVSWGPYWSMYDECDCIGVDIAKKLLENGIIKGSTYVEAMQTESGGKILELDNPDFEDYTCEVSLFDNEEKEKLKDHYLKIISKNNNNYDNHICVILDAPYFEYSDSKYYTITIVVIGKDREFIVNLGCTNNMYYNIEAEEVVKKLIL